jgi:adenosylcobinamide-GDP ribazoletransferase
MNGLRHELRLVGVALQFLTRVPLPRSLPFEPAWLHASARHFPLVGAAVGAVGAAVLWGAALWWPLPVTVLLAMVATVLLTGGFHEDGLADTCDALGGAVDRERALEIMKDSRLGSYGALGLVLVLALKAAALWGLSQRGVTMAAVPAWLLAHAASRAGAVALLHALPYAGDLAHAKAKPMAQQVSRGSMWVAFAWVALLALSLRAVLGPRGAPPLLAALAGAAVMALMCARWFRRRLGGYTGDTLGAAQQLGEVAALLGWLALAGA